MLGVEQRGGQQGLEDADEERVVVEVVADPVELVGDVHADLLQMVGRPDAGEHQQLR